MIIDRTEFPVLYAAARRERAEAIYRLVFAPVVAFFTRPPLPLRHTRMLRRSAFG